MTQVIPIEFAVQSNPGRFAYDGDARLVNCYSEAGGEGSKAPLPIYAVDGLKSFASQTSGLGTRGLIDLEEKQAAYWVCGRLCFKADLNGNLTTLGSVGGDGPVRMARNQASPDPEIAIVANGSKFQIKDDTLTTISDPDIPAPVDVVYNAGRLIYVIADGRIVYTDVEDADSAGPSSFATAEAIPDGLVAAYSAGREIWFLGRKSTEAWQATTSSTNPFQRIPGGVMTKGCLSTFSVARLDNSFAWLGDDGVVYQANGMVPVRISHRGVENSVKTETSKSLIEAFSYRDAGHDYYVLSGTNFTWIYDAQTKRWHERQSDSLTRWRGAGHAKLGDKHLVGDNLTGALYELDRDTGDEAGNNLTMVIQSPIQHGFPDRVAYYQLYLDFNTGVGLNTTDAHNQDPQVMLRFRDTGDNTWSNEYRASLGKIGERSTRVMFQDLGADGYHGRDFEIRVSAAVTRGFLGGSARVERLAA